MEIGVWVWARAWVGLGHGGYWFEVVGGLRHVYGHGHAKVWLVGGDRLLD